MKILMVDPTYFDVLYAINPHMLDDEGRLKKIDKGLAFEQFRNLANVFKELGVIVQIMPGAPGLPDMVFSANHGLPFFWSGSKKIILGEMAAAERKPEIAWFQSWYESNGWEVIKGKDHGFIQGDEVFEGMGDCAWQPSKNILWCGVGSRSSGAVWQRISKTLELQLEILKLVHPKFYHLDTCMSVLDSGTVARIREAFSDEGNALIEKHFERVIDIDLNEGEKFLSGNCWSPDHQHVVLQKGAQKFESKLRQLGFTPVPVDTSEFLKAGGSVFCMKMILANF